MERMCTACEGVGIFYKTTPNDTVIEEQCIYCRGKGTILKEEVPASLQGEADPIADMPLEDLKKLVDDFDPAKLSPFAKNMLATLPDEREALFFLLTMKTQLEMAALLDHYKTLAAAIRIPLVSVINKVVSGGLQEKIGKENMDLAEAAILATMDLKEVAVAEALIPKEPRV